MKKIDGGTKKIEGGTKKIKDFKPCLHPMHNPPSLMVFSPGEYEHTCPGCGNTIRFSVPGVTC
jgi:hypothetical protein